MGHAPSGGGKQCVQRFSDELVAGVPGVAPWAPYGRGVNAVQGAGAGLSRGSARNVARTRWVSHAVGQAMAGARVSVLPDERTRISEGTRVAGQVGTDEQVRTAEPWVTIVWNDPVNLMSYVVYVFESYFGYPPAKANRLMLQVHHEGKAVVSSGSRERMEVDVQAMHGFGLWATMQRGGDL